MSVFWLQSLILPCSSMNWGTGTSFHSTRAQSGCRWTPSPHSGLANTHLPRMSFLWPAQCPLISSAAPYGEEGFNSSGVPPSPLRLFMSRPDCRFIPPLEVFVLNPPFPVVLATGFPSWISLCYFWPQSPTFPCALCTISLTWLIEHTEGFAIKWSTSFFVCLFLYFWLWA